MANYGTKEIQRLVKAAQMAAAVFNDCVEGPPDNAEVSEMCNTLDELEASLTPFETTSV
jgi:hypothetical protein